MMAQAAIPLGIEITLLAASAEDGAAKVVPNVIVGAPDDPKRIRELAERVDVVTFDHELVDADLLEELEAEGHRVHPSPAVMRLAQNKRLQRQTMSDAGLPAPAWSPVGGLDGLERFASEHDWPVVVKSAQGGYDGRGVWVVENHDAAAALIEETAGSGIELLVEAHQTLQGELAVLVARNADGACQVFPATETVQRDGICHELHVPARFGPDVSHAAERIAMQIADRIGSTGILAIEFFVVDGQVLINELAPRPHNSGHWTIEGAEVSQFEQHLRAVLNWPLGSTDLVAGGVMTRNLLGPEDGGDPFARIPAALRSADAHIHWYGKDARPGRKIGHVTARAGTLGEAECAANAVWSVLMQGEAGDT
jgi:5-(carboxyamino)imidazole ribonucleotide synthase